MNFKRILSLTAAVAAVGAAAGVCVVAASFAIYALAREALTPAGAGAVVAAVFALLALIVAWLATRKVVPKKGLAPPPPPASPVERVMALAKERPLIALGAAAVATTVLVRNPAMVTALISAFVAGNNTPKPPK